ncbi:MAG: aminodeoxychorismate/anthranilate synthase component II [Micavibrio sp.]|nr:aminodeoxychorismate/anthranilate synthase component II [Micavibrio sp.]
MFLVLDNYDSFVHNLARYFEMAGERCEIIRSDEITIEQIKEKSPTALILSPGPKSPRDAGVCVEAVKQLGADLPILGICLGHQAIGEAYGGKTIKGAPVHGKASTITHDSSGVFDELPSSLEVGRYHSLIVDMPETARLTITARTENGEIMAMQHATHPVYGLQFHPESILTEHGHAMIVNFIHLAHTYKRG